MHDDALALIELDSIARGYRVVDALVKRSPVRMLEANVVEPGKFLVLFSGGVAEVEEALTAATEVGEGRILDSLFLPQVHDAIIPGLGGSVDADEPDTLGVVEGRTIATTLVACDAALKEASVRLAGLRVVTGLGGKAYFVVHGSHSDVEAALEASAAKLGDALVELQCIPVPHEDFIDVLLRPPPFRLG